MGMFSKKMSTQEAAASITANPYQNEKAFAFGKMIAEAKISTAVDNYRTDPASAYIVGVVAGAQVAVANALFTVAAMLDDTEAFPMPGVNRLALQRYLNDKDVWESRALELVLPMILENWDEVGSGV